MAHKIGIYYNEPSLRDIMKCPKLGEMEQGIMQRKLSQVQAEFLQHFGFEGKFEIKAAITNSRRSRLAYRVIAADAKTTAALKKEPGWIAKFI